MKLFVIIIFYNFIHPSGIISVNKMMDQKFSTTKNKIKYSDL